MATFPPSFYKYRTLVSDKISACVFIWPKCRPSRDHLPRELITDYGLQRVLAFSATGRSELIGLAILRDEALGPRYLGRLVELLDSDWLKRDFALVADVSDYVRELRTLESAERHYIELAREANRMKASIGAVVSDLVAWSNKYRIQ